MSYDESAARENSIAPHTIYRMYGMHDSTTRRNTGHGTALGLELNASPGGPVCRRVRKGCWGREYGEVDGRTEVE